MAERNISRPWSEGEGNVQRPVILFTNLTGFLLPDNLLRAGVAEHGEIDNWKIIALTIPGRTNKACRKVILPGVDMFFSRISLLSAFPN